MVIAFLVGAWFVRSVLRRLVRSTETQADDALLTAIGPNLKWLLVLAALYFGTVRLVFVSPEVKEMLGDIYFSAAIVLLTYILIKTVDFAKNWYQEERLAEEDRERLRPFLTPPRHS